MISSSSISRQQALKKLKICLTDFRRLCIIKGIYPKETKAKPKHSSRIYFHRKDIAHIKHDPLLAKFSAIRTSSKSIQKAMKNQEFDVATKLFAQIPGYSLENLVRERYPRFIDALADLDDSLTMVHLFANMPADRNTRASRKMVEKCKNLSLEFQAYVTKTRSLRRVFLSFKGIYCQAEIFGQLLTWITPHQGGQVIPNDVDFCGLNTFLQFNICMLQFVNFRLFHDIGVKYPLNLNSITEEDEPSLESILLSISPDKRSIFSTRPPIPPKKSSNNEKENNRATTLQLTKKKNKLEQNSYENKTSLSKSTCENTTFLRGVDIKRQTAHTSIDNKLQSHTTWNHNHYPKINMLNSMIKHDDSTICSTIFEGLEFYLSREVPQELLKFLIWAFGGRVMCEDFKPDEIDISISNNFYVFDRPLQEHIFPTRKYVKPQWILDCVNFNFLVPTNLYGPGSVLPPHLSPFVNIEGYENSLDLVNLYRLAKWGHFKHKSTKELYNNSKEQDFANTYSQQYKISHLLDEESNQKLIVYRSHDNNLATGLKYVTKTIINKITINENKSVCSDSYKQDFPLNNKMANNKSRRLYKAINSSIKP